MLVAVVAVIGLLVFVLFCVSLTRRCVLNMITVPVVPVPGTIRNLLALLHGTRVERLTDRRNRKQYTVEIIDDVIVQSLLYVPMAEWMRVGVRKHQAFSVIQLTITCNGRPINPQNGSRMLGKPLATPHMHTWASIDRGKTHRKTYRLAYEGANLWYVFAPCRVAQSLVH